MNERLEKLIEEVMIEHKQKQGKKFSTYYEGQALLNVSLEDVTEELKIVAQGADILWGKLKEKDFGQEYTDVLTTMRVHGLQMLNEGILLMVMLDKLGQGVVHEPKE